MDLKLDINISISSSNLKSNLRYVSRDFKICWSPLRSTPSCVKPLVTAWAPATWRFKPQRPRTDEAPTLVAHGCAEVIISGPAISTMGCLETSWTLNHHRLFWRMWSNESMSPIEGFGNCDSSGAQWRYPNFLTPKSWWSSLSLKLSWLRAWLWSHPFHIAILVLRLETLCSQKSLPKSCRFIAQLPGEKILAEVASPTFRDLYILIFSHITSYYYNDRCICVYMCVYICTCINTYKHTHSQHMLFFIPTSLHPHFLRCFATGYGSLHRSSIPI